MKRLYLVLIYGLVTALGLVWALGCSNSTGGGQGGGTFGYHMEMWAQLTSIPAINGKDTVFCFLRFGDGVSDTLMVGQQVHFWTTTGYPQSSIVSQQYVANTPWGMDPPVVYNALNIPVGVDYDTIFAVYYNAVQETLARDTTSVHIEH